MHATENKTTNKPGAPTKNASDKTLFFQPKLTVNKPGDQYEREADHMAERVMRMPLNDQPFFKPSQVSISRLQRKCKSCEDDEKIHRKESSTEATEASGEVSSYISSLSSKGATLSESSRSFFEPRFNRDFSDVKIHNDADAARSAQSVNALAYTVGENIVFNDRQFSPESENGKKLLAHELTHVVQQTGSAETTINKQNNPQTYHNIQRKCGQADLGAPTPGCANSQAGVAGWQFLFKVGCDDLLPGEDDKINKLKPGKRLNIHGFASKDGKADFNDDLSCHRANKIAELVRAKRADCPVAGVFKHGASPPSAPGLVPDPNPAQFWQSVVIEEMDPTPQSGQQWLDPSSTITLGWSMYNKAQKDPVKSNLDDIAARRGPLKAWLEDKPTSMAPAGAKLTRQNLDDYRRFSDSAEKLWSAIDQLLALQNYPDAAKDTYALWAAGSGTTDQGSAIHAKNVPAGAKYQIDLFGEGYFPGAVNIGDAKRTSTTGVHGSRVPNLIYRHFSGRDAALNSIPIADHVADLVTSESGPISYPGVLEEIARITAPGGTIVLYNPSSMEQYHDKMATLTGGTITKVKSGTDGDTLESKIVVPNSNP